MRVGSYRLILVRNKRQSDLNLLIEIQFNSEIIVRTIQDNKRLATLFIVEANYYIAFFIFVV